MARAEDTLAAVLPAWRAAVAPVLGADFVDQLLRLHRPRVLALLEQWHRGELPASDVTGGRPGWFEQFNPRGGVPRESLPGFRRAVAAAADIFDRALVLLNESPSDLDLRPALAVLGSTRDELEFDYEEASQLAADLPMLLGTINWTPEEAGDLLAAMLDTRARGGIVPDDEMRAHIADRIWAAEQHLELRSIDKEQACDFVAQHHSLLPHCNPRGMMYAIGAFWRDEHRGGRKLVAVATAGTPTGRWGSGPCPVDGILELTRIASVSGLTRLDRRGRTVPVNASSALASRLMDLLPTSGRRGTVGCRFVTYSVVGERATTYLALVAKGLRPVGLIRGKAPKGAYGHVARLDKIVWEAGPAARDPDWSVLPEERRAGAIRAFDAGLAGRAYAA